MWFDWWNAHIFEWDATHFRRECHRRYRHVLAFPFDIQIHFDLGTSSYRMMVLHHPNDLDLDLDLDLGLDLDLHLDLDFRHEDHWSNDIRLYDATSSQ